MATPNETTPNVGHGPKLTVPAARAWVAPPSPEEDRAHQEHVKRECEKARLWLATEGNAAWCHDRDAEVARIERIRKEEREKLLAKRAREEQDEKARAETEAARIKNEKYDAMQWRVTRGDKELIHTETVEQAEKIVAKHQTKITVLPYMGKPVYTTEGIRVRDFSKKYKTRLWVQDNICGLTGLKDPVVASFDSWYEASRYEDIAEYGEDREYYVTYTCPHSGEEIDLDKEDSEAEHEAELERESAELERAEAHREKREAQRERALANRWARIEQARAEAAAAIEAAGLQAEAEETAAIENARLQAEREAKAAQEEAAKLAALNEPQSKWERYGVPMAVVPMFQTDAAGMEWVYVYSYDDSIELAQHTNQSPRMKIGRTMGNPRQRINEQVNSSTPGHPVPVMYVRCVDSGQLESQLHRQFGRAATQGGGREWFHVAPREIVEFVQSLHPMTRIQ